MAKVNRYVGLAVMGMLMCLLTINKTAAQNNYTLVVRFVDKDSLYAANVIDLKTTFSKRDECYKSIEKIPQSLQAKGFVSASVDSIVDIDNQTIIYLFFGEKYNGLNLRINQKDKEYLQQVGWDEKLSKKPAFTVLRL